MVRRGTGTFDRFRRLPRNICTVRAFGVAASDVAMTSAPCLRAMVVLRVRRHAAVSGSGNSLNECKRGVCLPHGRVAQHPRMRIKALTIIAMLSIAGKTIERVCAKQQQGLVNRREVRTVLRHNAADARRHLRRTAGALEAYTRDLGVLSLNM